VQDGPAYNQCVLLMDCDPHCHIKVLRDCTAFDVGMHCALLGYYWCFVFILWTVLMTVAAAAAFKAGKIQNNPFSQASTSGGAAIPPPSNLAGRIFCIMLP